MNCGIVRYANELNPKTRTVAVCIIGSGCGGATAARALSEAGHEVLVLEEGEDYTREDFTQRGPEMYDQLYMDRGGRVTEDMGVQVLQGRVLGGGGVINACDVVPISDETIEFWRDKHGLTNLSPEQFAPFTERALDDLAAEVPYPGVLNKNNTLLRGGAQKMGFRGEIMMHNRIGCAGLGTCLMGCRVEAKQNPRNVAIPAAIKSGAEFVTRARAVRIEDAAQEMKTVHVRTLDAKGYHEVGSWQVRAKTVILAANAIASTQLLLRSGIGNQHVGQHVSLQPQLPIVARYDSSVRAYDGIPQLYAVTEFEEQHPDHGLWGFRIEAISNVPSFAATSIPLTGAKFKEAIFHYPDFASSLLLVPDNPTETVSVNKAGRPVIRYMHHENHKERLRRAIKAAAECYLASGATKVIPSVGPALEIESRKDFAKVDALGFAPLTAVLISAHQQGGVRMAHSPDLGACDPDAQVYGTQGVHVFDSSWFPSSASSHTMTPIIAGSYYLCARWLSNHTS